MSNHSLRWIDMANGNYWATDSSCSLTRTDIIIACTLKRLKPGQTESQVDANWKHGSTCYSVWPGLACTCLDLRWLALTLVEVKFAPKSTQLFHRLATLLNPSQRKLSNVHNLLLPNEIQVKSALKWFFLRLACPFGHQGPTQNLLKFISPLLAITCESVWPGLNV